MGTEAFDQRHRIWIVVSLYAIGLLAPWEWLFPGSKGLRVWSWLAYQIFHARWMTSQQAFVFLTLAAVLAAVAGAGLTLWAAAAGGARKAAAGEWLTGAAVSLLMPHLGAAVFLVLLGLLEVRVALAAGRYSGKTPPHDPGRRWLEAIATAAYPIGVALSFAALAWNYDAPLLIRCVLICFGVSLVLQALVPVRAR